jgi:hypothetical protein
LTFIFESLKLQARGCGLCALRTRDLLKEVTAAAWIGPTPGDSKITDFDKTAPFLKNCHKN